MKGNKPDADATSAEPRIDSAEDAVPEGWSPMEFAAEQQALEFCMQGRKEAFRPLGRCLLRPLGEGGARRCWGRRG